MKIFFIGDFYSNTGPAISNKMLKKSLKEYDAIFSKNRNIIYRFVEMCINIKKTDGVCFCSYSKINILAIKTANLFNKKSFYIMHGYRSFEVKENSTISEVNTKKILKYEDFIFENVVKVFCVSIKFMQFMKKVKPEYIDKFDYNFNGIDLEYIESYTLNNKKDINQIISVGGGMKQKNNLNICKAIDKINKEKKLNLKYTIIGKTHTDKAELCKYDFVIYYDYLPHNEVLKLLAKSYLYIQNSKFETFGIAIIEALLLNCNLLISNNVGAIDIISKIEKHNIIFDTENIDEIASKIIRLINNDNSMMIKEGIEREKIGYKNIGKNLMLKINNYYDNSINKN